MHLTHKGHVLRSTTPAVRWYAPKKSIYMVSRMKASKSKIRTQNISFRRIGGPQTLAPSSLSNKMHKHGCKARLAPGVNVSGKQYVAKIVCTRMAPVQLYVRFNMVAPVDAGPLASQQICRCCYLCPVHGKWKAHEAFASSEDGQTTKF